MSIFDKIKKYSGTSFTYNKLNSNTIMNIIKDGGLSRKDFNKNITILKKKTAY